MIKIEGLLFERLSELMNGIFENARKGLSLSQKKFEEILDSEKGQEFFKVFDQTTTEFFLSRFTVKNLKKELLIAKKNSTEIVNSNQQLFQYFFAYVQTTHIVYQKLLDHLEKHTKANDLEVRDVVNIALYGNLCRLADQIGLLLINGYPDGALMLWRSFYEYSVVAVFLMKHYSNELAERFRDASSRDVRRKAESYAKRHTDLKFPALESGLIQDIQQEMDRLNNKYGKGFFDNDYSWAKDYVNDKPNFLNLESSVDFGRYRPFYIWASGKCHPNYQELTSFKDSNNAFVLRYVTTQEVEKTSMIDPSQLTLAVFDQVNSYFLDLYSVNYEYETNMMMFRKIYEKFSQAIS